MTTKEKIKRILFEITMGTRASKIDTILEYAGDEFEYSADYIVLAKKTDEQLNWDLRNIAEYILDNE